MSISSSLQSRSRTTSGISSVGAEFLQRKSPPKDFIGKSSNPPKGLSASTGVRARKRKRLRRISSKRRSHPSSGKPNLARKGMGTGDPAKRTFFRVLQPHSEGSKGALPGCVEWKKRGHRGQNHRSSPVHLRPDRLKRPSPVPFL